MNDFEEKFPEVISKKHKEECGRSEFSHNAFGMEKANAHDR